MEVKNCLSSGSYDIDKIISGLLFTIDMFLTDPITGEQLSYPRNSEDEITIKSCLQAIEVLKKIK